MFVLKNEIKNLSSMRFVENYPLYNEKQKSNQTTLRKVRVFPVKLV